MKSVYRYQVPVDDQWHEHNLIGAILHVHCRTVDVVEFWALSTAGVPMTRSFRVFGTGQGIPDATEWRGTALSPGEQLVWHLFEAIAPELPSRQPAGVAKDGWPYG